MPSGGGGGGGGGTFNGGTITDQLTIHPPVDTNALTVRANAGTTFADLLLLQNQTGHSVVEIDSSDDVTVDSRDQGGTIALLAVGGFVSAGFANANITARTGKQARVVADGGDVTLDNAGTTITGSIGFYGHAVAAQAAAIPAAAGGAIIDAEARSALNALLTAMRACGLIAT